ncbi:MAG: 4-hydroxythreonine-4-phosphate dehydrogenase PdxA, partial [Prevotella sp.]|nr:4-hydroxythreonine-4-phosphate dehydrogenase PdxA [Candidatus Prevotella equi]
NAILQDDNLADICSVELYGADGQPEQEALADAIEDWQCGDIDIVVCLPMKLSARKALREHLPEEMADVVMLHINETIAMASVMGAASAADAAAKIKTEDVKSVVQKVAKALKRDLFVLNPRVAVMSMNENIVADEASKEFSVIAPAVSELVKEGVQTFGPLPYKTFFESPTVKAYDAVVAMYDEQCETMHRELCTEDTVMLASGLSVPMVFAEPESLLKAFFVAIDAWRNREEYDYPAKNPLPKLYHERKEDGDKARFAVKKKGFNPAEHRRENVTFTTAKTPAPQE